MQTILKVEGMTCGHCAQSVTDALTEIAGVGNVHVDLEKGVVHVEGQADPEAMKQAIEEEGYTVK